MKKTIFITFTALLFSLQGHTQSCLPDGIEFNSQADINNFPTNYPGCTVIEGNAARERL